MEIEDDAWIERACSDCLAPGRRVGIDRRGHEIVEIEHDSGCPHILTGGAA